MRLHDADCMLIYEAFEMLIEMAVIVITIIAEMKIVGEAGQVFYSPSDPHDLQCLFTGNACSGFKIALQSA